jgi:hypothetical protein
MTTEMKIPLDNVSTDTYFHGKCWKMLKAMWQHRMPTDSITGFLQH